MFLLQLKTFNLSSLFKPNQADPHQYLRIDSRSSTRIKAIPEAKQRRNKAVKLLLWQISNSYGFWRKFT